MLVKYRVIENKMSYANVNISDELIDEVIKVKNLYKILDSIPNSFKLLNICVNSYGWKDLPPNYDVYILGFWHEVFDENWFLRQYKKNFNSTFIILGDFSPNDLVLYDRVEFFKILHWKYYIPNRPYVDINWKSKKFKISSLSHYVNEYRFFITAYLLNRDDVLFSYHNKHRQSTYLPDEKDGNTPIRDSLLKYKNYLSSNSFYIDDFVNDPIQNYNESTFHPAYANSLVNSINETKDISYTDDFGILPGPYLTEKTWKPISTGTGLLFSAQMNTASTLESAGFIFDYPWENSYSNLWQDAEKIEQLLFIIDTILGMSHKDIENGIKHSCEYNASYIRSNQFIDYIDFINQKELERLNKKYGI